MKLVFGSYNLEFGGMGDDGGDARLRRQLSMLAAARADAWAFQECSGWGSPLSRVQHMVEEALGMRGFIARSNRAPGRGDVAVFVRESAGITVKEVRHDEGVPWWHAVAHVVTEVDGLGPVRFASAHLAPSSPALREIEAEAFQLIAEKDRWGPLIAGGDWNAVPPGDPVPGDVTGVHPGKVRRKTDDRAGAALAEYMTDVAAVLGNARPTVGHTRGDKLAYRCDRLYTTLPREAVTGYEVVCEDRPESDHRPVLGFFNLAA